MSPRGKGLLGVTQVRAPLSKSQSLRALNALGIGFASDLDQICKRGSMAESPGSRERTKYQEKQGMPLSGSGACIDLVSGRRCQGLSSGRTVSPHEAKKKLGCVSIDSHMSRMGYGAKHPSSNCAWRGQVEGRRERHSDFEHSLQAEGYAQLLGRPEGVGKRPTSLDSRRSARGLQPVGPKAEDGGHRDPSLGNQAAPSEDANQEGQALIAALRDAPVQNPAVWDAMLNAVSNAQQLFTAKNAGEVQAAQLVEGSQVSRLTPTNSASAITPTRTSRVGSPSKGFKSYHGSSPRKSTPGSESTADTPASPASSITNASSPCARRDGAPSMGPPADVREQWKAARRAGWV